MEIMEGNISVKAALLAHVREVKEVWIDEKKNDRDTRFILAKAYEQSIPVIKCNKEKIDEVASGKTHGGCIAFVGERTYQKLDDILKKDKIFLAIVEGIEDPFNFGYVCRILYAAGCDGLLVSERNWSTATTTVTKSSAGASEYLPLIPIGNIDETLNRLKEKNIPLYCAMREDAIEYYDADFNHSCCIALGGEMRGLSKSILSHSSQNIYIPYANDYRNALNAAAACSAIAFEIVRQRRK